MVIRARESKRIYPDEEYFIKQIYKKVKKKNDGY